MAFLEGVGLKKYFGGLKAINNLDFQIKKGEIIGHTGQTGLAGGDHLHFGIMVNGTFVNPIEWWDAHWIEDNVERKLALIEE